MPNVAEVSQNAWARRAAAAGATHTAAVRLRPLLEGVSSCARKLSWALGALACAALVA